jgi:hypothetical protein
MAEDLITVHFAGVERRIALWAGITVDTLVRSIQSSFGVNAPIAVILREPDNVVVPAEYVVAMRKGSFNIVFGTSFLVRMRAGTAIASSCAFGPACFFGNSAVISNLWQDLGLHSPQLQLVLSLSLLKLWDTFRFSRFLV